MSVVIRVFGIGFWLRNESGILFFADFFPDFLCTDFADLFLIAIDAGVEKVVQALKDNNMYENSYIIFTSDNGGSNQAGASTWPLRGAKGSYYEGGKRTRTLIR